MTKQEKKIVEEAINYSVSKSAEALDMENYAEMSGDLTSADRERYYRTRFEFLSGLLKRLLE